jgi:DNA-binding MurR/RpiR family transcriptional regulator
LVANASGAATVDAGALAKIRALLPSLIPSDGKVARAILDDPGRVIHLSVGDVAGEAQTSPSTVVRACQRMGFRGFQHLKIALAQELGAARGPGVKGVAEGSPASVLRSVFSSASRTLSDSLFTLSDGEFAEAVSAVRDAKKLLFVGVGTSAPLAQDAAYRFLTIGVRAEAPADVHTQHVAARLLSPGDVCFAVSHTGATRETVANVKTAREQGAKTVVVTSFSRSPITEHAEIVLVAGGPEDSFRLEAMASRVAHLMVLDALFVAVAQRTPERASASLDAYADVLSEHRF